MSLFVVSVKLLSVNWSGLLGLWKRYSEEASSAAVEEIEPLATDVQISVSTSLIVLAVYTATLHVSVPGGDSGIYLSFLY